MKNEPGRLTVLIDPETKAKFVHECELADVTPSQMVRKLIREFVAGLEGQPASLRDGSAADTAPEPDA